MKYIRTKDGIIEINPTLTNEQIDISLGKNTPRADTIEELCDEFVFVGLDYPKVLDTKHNFSQIDIRQVLFNISMHNGCLYGAIWTDKGLIYVAKMNEKGELELL